MIKLNDLAIGYNGEAILEHIDQEFDDGLIYGILAKSGAGKTTLLKTIAGLLRPVHGEVVIDGTTYRNADKNPVYMMHQRYSNFGWLSCTENVLIAQRDKKLRSRDDAIKVLAAVGLEQYADMDGIVFRSDFAQAHPDVVTAFIDGIFQANAMYTTEFDYIRSVMPMFAGVSDEEIKAQCGDAEMMGYAENKEVLDSTAPSVYFDMCDIWESLGETVNRKAAMTLFDNQYLLPLASKYSSTSASTSKPVELTEEQKQEIVNYEALLSKSMTVEFVADTAQFKNPEEAYAIMDEFVSIANTLDGAIIQVEGNINARNYSDSGQALSAERAKAVAKYFIACGIDPNRLITVGNGNTKMVADPGSADAYLNRRTDVFFKIIEE